MCLDPYSSNFDPVPHLEYFSQINSPCRHTIEPSLVCRMVMGDGMIDREAATMRRKSSFYCKRFRDLGWSNLHTINSCCLSLLSSEFQHERFCFRLYTNDSQRHLHEGVRPFPFSSNLKILYLKSTDLRSDVLKT
jgi:hypothetical protein